MHNACAASILKYDWSISSTAYSACPGETIDWSYTNNNTGFGVYVLALDQSNYPQFPNGTFTGFPLAATGGPGYFEFGSFDVPYNSSWRVAFVNNESAAIGKQISLIIDVHVNYINVSAPSSTVSGQPSTVNYVLGGTTSYVNLWLYRNGVFSAVIANGIAANGSYAFTMPDVLSGDGYRIMIFDWSDTNTNSSSPMFAITPSAIIITPNKTSSWTIGTTQDITYIVNGSTTVNLFLDKGGNGTLSMEIASDALNNGSYPWILPSGLPAGNDYSVELQVSESYAVYSATFSIDLPTITIQSPAPNSSYAQGSVLPITYTALGVSSVDIYLYNGTTLLEDIALGVINNGSYSWAIPTPIGTGTNYFVKIVDHSNASIVGQMPSGFTITTGPPKKTNMTPGFEPGIVGFIIALATCALALKMARTKRGTL
jgi:hypothetical protein